MGVAVVLVGWGGVRVGDGEVAGTGGLDCAGGQAFGLGVPQMRSPSAWPKVSHETLF